MTARLQNAHSSNSIIVPSLQSILEDRGYSLLGLLSRPALHDPGDLVGQADQEGHEDLEDPLVQGLMILSHPITNFLR